MLLENVQKDRRIYSIPKSFNPECTPYMEDDFSEFVKTTCGKYKSIMGLKICKVIIVGDVAAGKTSLVNRFCHETFDANYKATIGVDFEIEKFDILNTPFNLQIWDTAGQERFKCIAQSYYRCAHVIVIVFDFMNLMTLSHCRDWLDEAMRDNYEQDQPFIFLVGTKKDLMDKVVYNGIEKYAIKVARELNAEYWAVSAKSGDGVRDLFLRMAALTFNKSIERERETVKPIEIGTDLVSLKKNAVENLKNNRTACGSCSK